ncbi:MAG: glycosyltransferase [Lachnospiraceae bacterium]|nr:glycosyltransferase [Lachnospiraceae bacterium]
MKFTVIILLYNADNKSIKNTIDSILKQKNMEYNIVLADDASSNDCVSYAKKYLEDNDFFDYKLSVHEENVGTVRNVYDALSVADGKYVKLIGAGDLLYNKNVLKNVYEKMSAEDSAMCFGKIKGYRKENDKLILEDISFPYDICAFEKNDIKRIRNNILVNHGWIVGASMFHERLRFKKCLEELVGKVRYCEDLTQSIFLLHKEKISYLDKGVIYYETVGGVSTDKSKSANKRMMDDINSIDKLLMEKYSSNSYVVKGNQMFKWQRIENARKRQIKIFFGNQNYVRMILKTILQKKHYRITEKGFLDYNEK